MKSKDLEAKLSKVDYQASWIKYGILTEKELDNQLQELSLGEDTNKEHYRYRTLSSYFKSKEVLSDVEIKQVVNLLRQDPDISMASSALITILKRPLLTDEQFELISETLKTFGNWTERHIEKQKIIRQKKN